MPVTATTGTAQVATDTAAYDRKLRYALRAPLQFSRVADVQPVNQTHPGSSVVFNFRNDHAVATTPLTELTDPAGVAGSDATSTVTLNEYGSHEDVSAKLRGTAYVSEMMRAANTMGYNGGLSFDTLARDPLLAGTNVLFPDNYNTALTGIDRATIAVGDVFQAAAVRLVYQRLVDANAVPYEDGYFKAYIAAMVAIDLRTETGAANWREPHVNAGDPSAVDPIWSGSIGTFEGVDFMVAPRLAAAALPAGFVNGGAGSTVDVYPTVFCAQEALGKAWSILDNDPVTGLVQNGPEPVTVIGPVTDSLRRFGSIGWYWLGGFGRIREAALWRVESAASFGANT